MRIPLTFVFFFGFVFAAPAQDTEYEIKNNIHYYSDSVNRLDAYKNERCLLDIYFPKNIDKCPVIVWFHGGGLSAGEKQIPEQLKGKKCIIVGIGYRLSPRVKCPAYIEDAAAAVAWVFNNINQYHGDPKLVFISGHSAGGYLALMIGLDKKWLNAYKIDANRIAGLIPFSGQAITHFTIRKEKGIEETRPVIDEYAPLYHVRADAPPLILITGDRELELLGRYEENAYLMRMMKLVGHKETILYELDGYGHGMAEPAYPLLLKQVAGISERINGGSKK